MSKWYFRTINVTGIVVLLAVMAVAYGCVQKKIAVTQHDCQANKIIGESIGAVCEKDVLSTVAKVDLVSPQGHHPIRALMVMKRPSFLRIEILSPVGPPDLFFAATPEQLCIFIPSRGEYYQGSPSSQNLERFLALPLDMESMVMILTGGYPVMNDGNLSYKCYRIGNNLHVEMRAKKGHFQVVQLSKSNKLLSFIKYDVYGKKLYQVRYEDYKEGERLPGKITVEIADGSSSLRVEYTQLQMEEADDLSIFELPPPEGIKVINLE